MKRTYSRKRADDVVEDHRSLSPPPKASSWLKSKSKASEEPKQTKKAKKDSVPNGYVQSYLDISKKGLGVEVCSICHMRYSKGVALDESIHRDHCKVFRNGVKWPKGLACATTIQNYSDGAKLVKVENVSDLRADSVVKKAMELADSELGFVDGNEPPGDGKEETVYLLVSETSHVIGCCVVVPIDCAYRVIPEEEEVHTSEEEEKEEGGGDKKYGIAQDHNTVCSSEPVTASVGISRIWVHSASRRNKHATRMLDAVLLNQGCKKEDIAFSQPTQFGRILASKWFQRKDFLVFKK